MSEIEKLNETQEERIKRVTAELRLKNADIIARRRREGYGASEEERIAIETRKREEQARKERKADIEAKLIVFGILSVIAVVVVMAWNGFVTWVNNQPAMPSEDAAHGQYGEYGSRERKLRDAANALYDTCTAFGSGYDARCN